VAEAEEASAVAAWEWEELVALVVSVVAEPEAE
jgi:hypothetical protein